jgi:AcrR family transcriptional regulator
MRAPTREQTAPGHEPRPPASEAALRTVQPRARATRDALLSAARSLLAEREFDAISVADIAAAAGLSVGSFYGRFRDKDGFFTVLQQQITGEWVSDGRRLLAPARLAGRPARFVIDAVCAAHVRTMRRDGGFVRAALKHASVRPDDWTPIRDAGRLHADAVVEALAPRLQTLAPASRPARIRFAMQVLYGTAFNAVLNDPGPIRLADARFARELARAFAAYLEVRDDPGPA